MCNLLSRLEYDGKDEAVVRPDPNQVIDFYESYLQSGLITP